MVQEVQTWVGITNETTLETIEAIGTSSFKIIEGRQTKGGHYVSSCKASGRVTWSYSQSIGIRDSGEVKSTDLAITESTGKAELILKDWGIRVPNSGSYEIVLDRSWGASTTYATVILKWGGKVLYTKQFTSSDSEVVTVVADLWKFELIELWGEFYYNGSATSASLLLSADLTITQL